MPIFPSYQNHFYRGSAIARPFSKHTSFYGAVDQEENARTAAPRTFWTDQLDHTLKTWMCALVSFTSCQGDMS